MELDIKQISATKARWKHHAGGLDYLLARVRGALQTRWTMHQSATASGENTAPAPHEFPPKSTHESTHESPHKSPNESPHESPHKSTNESPHESPRLLLIDFAGAQWDLAATITHLSLLESSPAGDTDRDADFDAVIICLQPAWLDLDGLWAAALQKLRPGGVLLLCTFGPDTLQEVRWAWSRVDDLPHVHPFIDMHLIGDQLLHCGFVGPIMDMDCITVTYPRAALLYADLRREGFTNILASRRKTLTGRARWRGYCAALESLRAAGEPLAITYELIYGIATAPAATHSAQVRIAPPHMPGR